VGNFLILVMSHFLLIPTLKEFKTSTNICQSYSKNKSGPVFSDSQCISEIDLYQMNDLVLVDRRLLTVALMLQCCVRLSVCLLFVHRTVLWLNGAS